jgi:hypothetical protein
MKNTEKEKKSEVSKKKSTGKEKGGAKVKKTESPTTLMGIESENEIKEATFEGQENKMDILAPTGIGKDKIKTNWAKIVVKIS